MEQKQTQKENRLVVAKEGVQGAGWIGNLELADANYYMFALYH